ncbi:MAG: DUF1049 domain-containing protein [Alphaproteobacteria bacterium]|nr:DUF1049 domain-containing protein [Alphaproteobacteria bacterium]
MRKLVTASILVPIAAAIVMFAVANRRSVVLSFDPFSAADPALALSVPLYVLIFLLVGVGILVGGVAAWLRQHKWRARARRAEADARELRTRLDAQGIRETAPARLDPPPFAVPPAA